MAKIRFIKKVKEVNKGNFFHSVVSIHCKDKIRAFDTNISAKSQPYLEKVSHEPGIVCVTLFFFLPEKYMGGQNLSYCLFK